MIKWAGRLIVIFGAAHTLLALTVEKATRHARAWFSGGLWGDDLSTMSPAGSAYWLTAASFGPPFILVGLIVLWLDRHGITPPTFIAWTLGIWTVVLAVVLVDTPWPILLLANILLANSLLLVGARRVSRHDDHEPHPDTTPTPGRRHDQRGRSTPPSTQERITPP